jgi:hypothetical protein
MSNLTSRQLFQAALVVAVGFVGAGMVSADERTPEESAITSDGCRNWPPKALPVTFVAAKAGLLPGIPDTLFSSW